MKRMEMQRLNICVLREKPLIYKIEKEMNLFQIIPYTHRYIFQHFLCA